MEYISYLKSDGSNKHGCEMNVNNARKYYINRTKFSNTFMELPPITTLEPGLWQKTVAMYTNQKSLITISTLVTRSSVTLSKYRNQMAWRRIKLKNFLHED